MTSSEPFPSLFLFLWSPPPGLEPIHWKSLLFRLKTKKKEEKEENLKGRLTSGWRQALFVAHNCNYDTCLAKLFTSQTRHPILLLHPTHPPPLAESKVLIVFVGNSRTKQNFCKSGVNFATFANRRHLRLLHSATIACSCYVTAWTKNFECF